MRLLTEPAFVAEFDMMVDEIAASYVAGQFTGKEKEQVEQYFLRSPERRKKLGFMAELLHQVDVGREEQTVSARQDERPSFSERVNAFLNRPHLAQRFATVAIAVVLLLGGVLWLNRSRGPSSTKFVSLTLTISDAERSTTGQAPETVKLPADVNEVRLQLLLPSESTQPVRYRADFASPADVRGLTIAGQDSRSVVITVPASELKPDRYAVRLFIIHPDGQEDRVPGNYMFRVE